MLSRGSGLRSLHRSLCSRNYDPSHVSLESKVCKKSEVGIYFRACRRWIGCIWRVCCVNIELEWRFTICHASTRFHMDLCIYFLRLWCGALLCGSLNILRILFVLKTNRHKHLACQGRNRCHTFNLFEGRSNKEVAAGILTRSPKPTQPVLAPPPYHPSTGHPRFHHPVTPTEVFTSSYLLVC